MTEKLFAIRCKSDAVICERWIVSATNANEAQQRFEDGHESVRFVEDFSIEGEEDRRDFEVTEAQPEDRMPEAVYPYITALRAAADALSPPNNDEESAALTLINEALATAGEG